jgi:hypothetical protein
MVTNHSQYNDIGTKNVFGTHAFTVIGLNEIRKMAEPFVWAFPKHRLFIRG